MKEEQGRERNSVQYFSLYLFSYPMAVFFFFFYNFFSFNY